MAATPEILRIGLIGLGGAAMQMLPSLMAHPRVELQACVDLNADVRNRFATDFGATPYAEVEALCADPGIDAVYIASPHEWHRAHAVMAAEAGKHVVVEKPMALTLEDCDAMIEAAENTGIRMIIGHTHGFDAPIMKMHDIIRGGDFGPVTMINTFSYGNFLYRPRRPEELNTGKGGGIIFNQVPHQIDVVRLLGGGMVHSVRSATSIMDADRPTEGSHATFLQFKSGAAAVLVYSGYDFFDSDEFHGWIGELGERRQPGGQGDARAALRTISTTSEEEIALKDSRAYLNKPLITVAGNHPHCGVTIVSCAGGDLRPVADGVMLYGKDGPVEVKVPPGRAFPDKGLVIDELYEAVAECRDPIRNGRWGKATMEASLAVLESARTKKEIVLEHQVPLIDS
ncbi:MAG: Gfo/Idh/MocA family oxidoreductase [Pseudomonadota bacterium]|nr:Gfo/Idh/MocA family oxidoreductase [Pseudomonadota bacterium]